MMKRKLTILLFLLCSAFLGVTQTRTVTGTVTDEAGEPAVAATVRVTGTDIGAVTDVNGDFSISGVPADAETITVSYIGMEPQTVPIEDNMTISLAQSDNMLDDVVVTALGITRDERSLGYGVSEVKGEDLSVSAETDVGRLLDNQAPGVSVTSSGGITGTSTNIIIRGYNSLNLSNQPLWVVDGTPINSDTNAQSSFTGGGQQTPSRFLDIDPNNIESISVLKGLAAANLYGSRGSNGVILVTTKNGIGADKKGTEITFTQSVDVQEIASLPEYQNQWGGGFHNQIGYFFSNWGPNFNTDFTADNFSRYQGSGVELKRIDDNGNVYLKHPYAGRIPGFEDAEYQYKAYPNNVSDFFRNGVSPTSSIRLSSGDRDKNINATFSYSDREGIMEYNDLDKFNFSVGGKAKLLNKFQLKGSMNFARTNMATPPLAIGDGSGAQLYAGFSSLSDVFYTPRSIDLTNLPYQNPVDGSSIYYRSNNDIQNPYWTLENTRYMNDTDRVFGNFEVSYPLLDNLNVSYRVGLDTYSEDTEYFGNKGGTSGQGDDFINGYYQTVTGSNTFWDHLAKLTYQTEFSNGISLDALVGFSNQGETYDRNGLESLDQVVYGVVRHDNFENTSSRNTLNNNADYEFRTQDNLIGALGSISLGYEDFIFLDLSGRNDWSSTLEAENNSVFYPSASISFIPTDAFEGFGGSAIEYMKLRLGYGSSAGFPNPYSTRSVLNSNSRAFVDASGNVYATNDLSNVLGNAALKPEIQKEIEAGLNIDAFQGRLTLDLSVYDRTNEDLITNADLDPSTGYTLSTVNVGEISNQGVEIGLGVTPVRNDDFSWSINNNFYAYETTVESLGLDINEIPYAGFTTLGNFAIEGETFGIMKGFVAQRNDDGELLVDESGRYMQSDEIQVIGDPNPDFTLGVTNSIRYKNFRLNAQLDYQQGGDMFSQFTTTLIGRGIINPSGISPNETVVLPGVKENGDPNDVQLTATEAVFSTYGGGLYANALTDFSVWDASHLRLRSVSIDYTLPSSLTDKLPIGSLSLRAYGNNLWFDAYNFPDGSNFDPEVSSLGASNGLGFEFLNGPSTKSFGLQLKTTF